MIGLRTKLKTISYFVQIWLPKFKMAEKVRNIPKSCYNSKKISNRIHFIHSFLEWYYDWTENQVDKTFHIYFIYFHFINLYQSSLQQWDMHKLQYTKTIISMIMEGHSRGDTNASPFYNFARKISELNHNLNHIYNYVHGYNVTIVL